MPSYYSPTYYEEQKAQHDFYINLGNQCRIAEEKRQALRKAELEERELLRQYQIVNKAKKVLEDNRKLKHALFEYNYTKDKELVLFTDRISWRDSLSSEEEAAYREWLRRDLGSDKIEVVNKIK